MKILLFLIVVASFAAQAQGYTRIETIDYHDDTSLWVLGQVKRTTCISSVPANSACDGGADSVISQTDYGWKALPWKNYSFGKLQQTLSYDSTSTVASGQLGTLKTAADGNGNVTTLTNWKRGVPQSIKYPGTPEVATGATQSAVVDNNGWVTSVTDETGSKTCYEYDPAGRVKKIIYPTEAANICDTGQSLWNSTTIDFSSGHPAAYGMPAGHWRQTTRTGNGRKVVIFDALWRPVVEQTLDLGNVAGTVSEVFHRYDSLGRAIFRSYPLGTNGAAVYRDPALKGTHTSYDAIDRVTQVRQDWEGTGQLTTTTAYLRNAVGPYTQVTNPRGRISRTWYQAWDQPSFELPVRIQHDNAYAYTDINRDVFGKPTSIVRRKGDGSQSVTRSYTYNVNQELCRTVEPETGATLMGYDGAGNLGWSASGLPAGTACHTTGNTATINARKANRTYDARNWLRALAFADGKGNQTWTYTPDGLPAKIVTAQPSVVPVENTYTYNRRRLLATESTKIASTIYLHQYNHNGNGHLSRMIYGSGHAIDYAPDALGRATRAGPYATGVKYYPNGAISEFTYGNGIRHTLTQNVRGLPDTSCDFYGSCNTSAILNDGYDYDQNGNVLAISDGRTGNRGNRTMTYDGLDRLTKAVSPMFGTAMYEYDLHDNITRATLITQPVPPSKIAKVEDHYYCYDASWRLTNVKTGSCSGATVIGLGYDPQGNVLNKNGQGYEFDLGNRLRRSTGKEWYAYDGHGRRVLSCTPTACDYQQYGFDGKLYYHRDNRSAKHFNNIYLGESLVAIWELPTAGGAVTVKYQHTDALGSPVAVTNASRAVVERTEYEPYGKPVNRAWRDGPGYTGHVEDAATGLNYMQQRYYDPQIGLFLSVDPVTAYEKPITNFCRYCYARNNPYLFTDPDGRDGSPFSMARADARIRELEASDPKAARTAQIQGYAAATAILFGPTGLMAGRAFWMANPVTANNVAIAGIEAVAGTSIAASQGAQLFRNLAPADDIIPAVLFSARQVQQASYSGRLNYVVMESGDLIIGRTGHTSLSRGADVLAAGEARFANGSLRSLDNASGHYRPSGNSAREAAESAFERSGFDAADKYRERQF